MEVMNNIFDTVIKNNNCFGCGVCAVACPKNIIEIELSEEGFYTPHIKDEDLCIHCGLCVDVCSFLDDNRIEIESYRQKSFAGYSNDQKVRNTTSSGGIAYEMANYFVSKKRAVCAVKYDTDKNIAKHFISRTNDELEKTKGSKYIQSYTVDGLRQLFDGNEYLFIGTPCQVDSLRRLARIKNVEDKILFVDFFCHGVPSMHLWKKYLNEKCGQNKLFEVSFRDKRLGWHSSWIMILKTNNKETFSPMKQGDLFYKFFLSDSCLNEVCYKCKFKALSSSADIRLGDLWGKTYNDDEKGVSGIIVNTHKGAGYLKEITSKITLKEESLATILEGQIKGHLQVPPIRYKIMKDLAGKHSLSYIYHKHFLPIRIKNKIKKLLNL